MKLYQRQSFLLWNVLTYIYVVIAAAPSSTGHWWDGMDFEQVSKGNVNGNLQGYDGSPPLQIPCGLILLQGGKVDQNVIDAAKVHPLQTILDTSLPLSQMSLKAAQDNELFTLMVKDEKHGDHIPAKSLWLRMGSLEATVPAPTILVKKDLEGSFSLRLGMDFLRQNQGVIDLRKEELNILVKNEDVMIPFIRPRAPISFSGDL